MTNSDKHPATPSGDVSSRADLLVIREGVCLPEGELTYRTSRSSGPGGQNVNKVETRVEVLLDLGVSPSFTQEQKERVRTVLATRITKDGVLRVVSQKHRTQAANREAARNRLVELLAEALEPRRPRRKTRPSKAAKRRRLESKRRRSEIKKFRRPPEG